MEIPLTPLEFFRRARRLYAERPAVVDGDVRLTYAQLESFYAVPQIGAVLVPLNFRLIADDFRYLITHSGSKVVCAHADYLECIDGIRGDLPSVEQFVALSGARDGWLDYEALVSGSLPLFNSVPVA